jgi:fibronectin-binding autotransporter adhesin
MARFPAWSIGVACVRALQQAGLKPRPVVMIEGLESRLLFANTVLYFDADGNTTSATGGSGTWNTTSLVWRLGSPTGTLQAWGNADPSTTTAYFGGTAGTVTIAAGTTINVNTIQAASNFTINGADTTAALNLSGATPTIDTGTANLMIGAKITGSGGLTKAATAGQLTLTGANTFTGTVDINAGTLTLQSATAAGAAGNAILLGDSTFGQNASLIYRQSGTGYTIANPINVQGGNGTRTIGMTGASSGTFTMDVSGLITLGKAITFTNTFTAANGFANFTGGIAGNGNVTVHSTGRPITFSGPWTWAGTLTNTGSGGAVITANLPNSITGITQSGTASLVIGGTSGYTGSYNVTAGTLAPGSTGGFNSSNVINLNGGTLNLKNPSGSSSQHFNITIAGLTGTGTVANASTTVRTITLAGGGNYNFTGAINGASVALNKTGSGTQTLSGTSSYTGATTVAGGTLIVQLVDRRRGQPHRRYHRRRQLQSGSRAAEHRQPHARQHLHLPGPSQQ